MKTLIKLFISTVCLLTSMVAFAQETSEVTVMYFHGSYRCATCNAVESVSKDAVKDLYGEKVTFQSVNTETVDKALLEKYQVTGKALLVVKGDKVVNLTNDGFMNARTKPEKLKAKIKETIDPLLP